MHRQSLPGLRKPLGTDCMLKMAAFQCEDLVAQMWAQKNTSDLSPTGSDRKLKNATRRDVASSLVDEELEKRKQKLNKQEYNDLVERVVVKYNGLQTKLKDSFCSLLTAELKQAAANQETPDVIMTFDIAHEVLIRVSKDNGIIDKFANNVDKSLSDTWAVQLVDNLMLQVVKNKIKRPSTEALIEVLRSMERPSERREIPRTIYDALQEKIRTNSSVVSSFAKEAIQYWEEVFGTALSDAKTELTTLRSNCLSGKSIAHLETIAYKRRTDEKWQRMYVSLIAALVNGVQELKEIVWMNESTFAFKAGVGVFTLTEEAKKTRNELIEEIKKQKGTGSVEFPLLLSEMEMRIGRFSSRDANTGASDPAAPATVFSLETMRMEYVSAWPILKAICRLFVKANLKETVVAAYEPPCAEVAMTRVDEIFNVQEKEDNRNFIEGSALVYMAGFVANELTKKLTTLSVNEFDKSQKKYFRYYCSWAAALAYNTHLDDLTNVEEVRQSKSRWCIFYSTIYRRSGGALLTPHSTLVDLIAALNVFTIDYTTGGHWMKSIYLDNDNHEKMKDKLKKSNSVMASLQTWREGRAKEAQALENHVIEAHRLASDAWKSAEEKYKQARESGEAPHKLASLNEAARTAKSEALAASTLVTNNKVSMDAINSWVNSDAAVDLIINKFVGALLGRACKQKVLEINVTAKVSGFSAPVREHVKNTAHKRTADAMHSDHKKVKVKQ